MAGLLSFEKLMEQDGDSVLVEEGNTPPREIASGLLVPAWSKNPRTLQKRHAREFGRSHRA